MKKHVTFHTLRHTYASHLVMAGVDLYTVSELFCHSSIEVTKRYAHLSPDHKSRATAKLEAYLREPK
ncbi:MAG: tyrosine-type recombinase/integrase, partial [Acidobacteriota bacterium]